MTTKRKTTKPKATHHKAKRHHKPRTLGGSIFTRKNPSSDMGKSFEQILIGAGGWIAVNIAVNTLLKNQTPAVKSGAKIALALALPTMVKHGKFAEAVRLGSFALATKAVVDYAQSTIFKGSSFAELLAGDELTADEIKLLNNLAMHGDNVSMHGDNVSMHGENDQDHNHDGYDAYLHGGDYSELPRSLFGEDDQ